MDAINKTLYFGAYEEIARGREDGDTDAFSIADKRTNEIKSHLRESQLEMLRGVKEMLEKYETTRNVSQNSNYDIGKNHGRQGMQKDLLQKLDEQIELIEKGV